VTLLSCLNEPFYPANALYQQLLRGRKSVAQKMKARRPLRKKEKVSDGVYVVMTDQLNGRAAVMLKARRTFIEPS
jgi:hypothetical protein